MQFDSFADFVAMGGYGFYVWLSFGCTLLTLGAVVVDSILKRQALTRSISQIKAKQDRMLAAREVKERL
ncbi:heme exporter protein CcmD [Aliagarivorans taiwanensis]|uniref:heme exporter protein CcmD n=1 Tax=Aliagarivorans taiwanensis TaxID=561966 RepID=UPI0003FF7C45|nr:heme exporter protein CcmD [Aliagarivorans taiwanensis]